MKYRRITEAGLIGLVYDADNFDCADFVVMAARALFNMDIVLPQDRPRGSHGQSNLGALTGEFVRRTSSPVDGDLILTREFGRRIPTHIGMYVVLDYQPYMLHCNDKPQPFSRCDRIADLTGFGLTIEGYYAWKLA